MHKFGGGGLKRLDRSRVNRRSVLGIEVGDIGVESFHQLGVRDRIGRGEQAGGGDNGFLHGIAILFEALPLLQRDEAGPKRASAL